MFYNVLSAVMPVVNAVALLLTSEGGSDAATTVQFSDFSSLMSQFLTQFSITNIVGVLSGTIGAGVGFVFLWWGARKLFKIITNATMRGKVKM